MRFTALALFTFLSLGCSSLRMAPNRLQVDRRWTRSTLNEEYLGGRREHRFAPILTDQLVIAGNSIDGIVAFHRKTGQSVWRVNIKEGVEGGATLVDGVLYFSASDGLLYALNVERGAILWTYPLKAEGLAKPTVKNGVVYVLGGNNVAHALEARSGKLIWQYNRREASNLSVRGGSQPALVGDLVLIGFSDGSLVALKKNSGSVMWEANLNRNKRFRDVDASPVIDGNTAYVSSYDGALYALNAIDGKIIWTVEEGGYDEVLLSKDTLYFSSSTGKTMAIDKASGKVRWSRINPRGIGTAPTILRDILLVGEMDGALRFLDARNGRLLASFAPGWGVNSKVTVDSQKNEIYFVSADANLFALRANWRRNIKDWPWE